MTPLAICVFCASSTRIERRHVELAAAAGAELARRGHSLITGGATVGSMGAVASAARAGGARTVGVIPQGLFDRETPDHGNHELIFTGDMRSRKGEMDLRADAFLVLPGGIGTLEELFEIWTARTLGMHDRPIVILDPDGVFEPLRAFMEGLVETGFARAGVFDAVAWATSVPGAFELLERTA